MDNNIIQFDPTERAKQNAEADGLDWEEDTDTVELGMGDLSDIADGFKMIREGLELISNATGVSLESV